MAGRGDGARASSATELRRALHAHPERSGEEHDTAARIRAFFAPLAPDETLDGLGGTGVAFAFGDAARGPTVLLRCELDALPIHEASDVAHRSRRDGCAHMCGHDGHMAILAAVGSELAADRPRRGRVVLLFQPAEESGAGARAVVADPRFARIRPDRAFALHNLPGHPLGQVVVRAGVMTCASRGLTVRLRGRPAHAAQPETGVSPTPALARLLTAFGEPARAAEGELRSITVVGATLGGADFGVAPERAELHATLRTSSDEAMVSLVERCEGLARAQAAEHGLDVACAYADVFDATRNAPAAVDVLRRSCGELPLLEAREPFRWSEDFGQLTRVAAGALFGLGAGERVPALHSDDYDFPDGLVDVGARLMLRVVETCLRDGA